MDIRKYLKQLDRELSVDNATEHTYRPTLQTLLERMLQGY